MKRFYYLLLAATLLGTAFRLYGISIQPPIGDEVQAAFSAENYMENGQFGPTMPYHPNLRNILVYASMKALGKGALGLRGFSLLFGVLGVPVLGLLIYRVTRNETASLLAAFFLAIDPVHIMFSRQAIQEVHTAFFFLLGTLLVLAGEERAYRWRALLLALAGASFGLGLASKAHALFPLAVCLAYVIHRGRKERRPWDERSYAVLSLTLLPLAIYMLTYLPWFRRGYGLGDWAFMQAALFKVMVAHEGNPMDSLVDTRPWQWFIKPFMGYANFTHYEGRPWVSMAVGNPLVWMLVLPSAYLAYRKRAEGRGLLLALFLVSYLPLAFTTRPVWVLSSIAVTPFAFGLVGLALAAVLKNRRLLSAYLAAVLLVSALLYPAAVGKTWEHEYLKLLFERLNPHGREILKGGPPAGG